MASDKPTGTNHVLPTNIKVESGTSMPVPLRNIKTEPGLPSTTTRLTSFRLPRDLTLGGNIKTEKPKKVYTPNLNAQRNKKKDDGTSVKNEAARPARGRDRERGRGRGDRGRGRGTNNLIQSTGVFSEGISELAGRRYTSRGGGGGGDDRKDPRMCLEKPKLNLDHKIDKAEEEEKLKNLLRDDFIDDGVEPDLDNAPVMLPMIEEAKLYKEEQKIGPEVQSDEEVDKKPIILENGEAVQAKKEVKVKGSVPNVPLKGNLPITVPQVIESKMNSYILIQFPDCLPGLESNNDANESKPKRPNDPNSERENENKSKSEFCTLNSLKGGMLGKLQVLKSGKARLLLSENTLLVDVGSTLSFRQDLLAAKVNNVNLDGDLVNLGPVNSTLICSPDWESMLAKL